MTNVQKQIDIQSGAIQRYAKELQFRKIDVQTEEDRLVKLESEGQDEWTTKKQVDALFSS